MKRHVSKVGQGECGRARVVARLRPEMRHHLKEAASRLGVSESRLIELGLEAVLQGHQGDESLATINADLAELNRNVARLSQGLESQGELLGHFIFQYFSTAPSVRKGEELAVKLSTTRRFTDFLSRIRLGMAAGKSIFELGQSKGPKLSAEASVDGGEV